MKTAKPLNARTPGRLLESARGRLYTVRSHPLLRSEARAAARRDRRLLPPACHDPTRSMEGALTWLIRAQDATPDDGFARGYCLTWNRYFRLHGWQPSYPETTGYIIPTFFMASRLLRRQDLAERAERAARWEIDVQLESGAVQGGVIGEGRTPAVFNTGQVLFGWLSAAAATGEERFLLAARRGAEYLAGILGDADHWTVGNSQFAARTGTLYNARAAWGLAEAGRRLGRADLMAAAARNLRAVARAQHPSGWFPDCCLSDPTRPLLHTQAYTLRGLLEGGRILEETALIAAAERGAAGLVQTIRDDGWMPGRYREGWEPAADWSCLTGQAQMANIWLRLFMITGDRRWLEPVAPVLSFLRATQNLATRTEGIHGGIQGSFPVWGEYGRYELLNWATKFFVDALIRHDLVRQCPTEAAVLDDGLA
jgi:hypothetical protein